MSFLRLWLKEVTVVMEDVPFDVYGSFDKWFSDGRTRTSIEWAEEMRERLLLPCRRRLSIVDFGAELCRVKYAREYRQKHERKQQESEERKQRRGQGGRLRPMNQ